MHLVLKEYQSELDVIVNEWNNNKELDYLYDLCDKWMINKELQKLNDLFSEDKKIPIVVMLGMLTATAPVKSKLPNRKMFIEKHRDELTDKMLIGLE